ncbi:chromate transporter [Gluconacetobacter johannae DSM 13595]|uniref:Chromate transporter n=1 Tax=Gluconacetobacter johannae TaxID=112140 RepID=A0A7W4J9Z9_9PROT|nr:chromate transporter [Gluconacetobacter johannae]MBB2177412.1 chromate transporter [Gluconacetobacter johannae]GBQ85439.1 chromate transporter [Gluconacetobacter johannae DSM 13595]
MSFLDLYVVLLRATITSFAGLASLPAIQDALVLHRHVLTEAQLNEAVVITRSTPGAVGLYVVSVGYFVSGVSGAVAGWLALVTPAVMIVPLLHYAGRRLHHPRLQNLLKMVVVSSAALLFAAAFPLAKDALTGWFTYALAAIGLLLMFVTKIDIFWIILGSAILSVGMSVLAAS